LLLCGRCLQVSRWIAGLKLAGSSSRRRLVSDFHKRFARRPSDLYQRSTPPRSSEGHQHVPCEHAHLRHISSQFLPRRSASDHTWRASILCRSIAFSTSVRYEMRSLCDTCIWVACVIQGSHAGDMGLASIRCLVCPLDLPHLCPIRTSSWPRL